MKAGKGKKAHKDEPALYFSCPLKKGPLLMRVPSWWSFGCGRSDSYTCWSGAHILCASILSQQGAPSDCPSAGAVAATAAGGGTMAERTAAITAKSEGSPWKMARRGGYFKSRSGITYCRGNGCGWYWGGRGGLHKVYLDLTLLAWLVPKFLLEKKSIITQSTKWEACFFLTLRPQPLFVCVVSSGAVLVATPNSACRPR